MPSLTNEKALEASIEKALTGACLEELKAQGITPNAAYEGGSLYRAGNGYFIGSPNDFNAIDEVPLCSCKC